MRKWWIMPLMAVFGLMLSLAVYIVYLSFVNLPRQELRTICAEGVLLQSDGTTTSCQVELTGILAQYRLGDNPPFYYTEELSSAQGLFLDGERLIGKMSLGWYAGRGEYITFSKNGTRLFLPRDLSFVVIITPDGCGGKQVAIAPADAPTDWKARLNLLGEDSWLRYICGEDCDLLLSYTYPE